MNEDFGITIGHAGIHVRDLDKTLKWYHEVFGFKLANYSFEELFLFKGGVFPRTCTARMGNFELEIFEAPEALPFNFVDYEYNLGTKHICFAIENIHAWIKYIKTLDVEIVVENYYGSTGVTIYLRDPDGILVEANDVREFFPIYEGEDLAERFPLYAASVAAKKAKVHK